MAFNRSEKTMPTVPTTIVLGNLRAVAEMLSLYPYRTVQDALDRLGASSAGIAPDLLDLSGSEACEVIEAEIVVLSSGWALVRAA